MKRKPISRGAGPGGGNVVAGKKRRDGRGARDFSDQRNCWVQWKLLCTRGLQTPPELKLGGGERGRGIGGCRIGISGGEGGGVTAIKGGGGRFSLKKRGHGDSSGAGSLLYEERRRSA